MKYPKAKAAKKTQLSVSSLLHQLRARLLNPYSRVLRVADKMVKVDWVDSMGDRGWSTPSRKSGICSTVGYLVERNKDCITVALNQCHSKAATRWGDSINIPACSIKKVRTLK